MRTLSITAAALLASTAIAAIGNPAAALPYAYSSSSVSNFTVSANAGSFTSNDPTFNNGTSTNTAGETGYAPVSTIDSQPNGTLANAAVATSGPGPFPPADTYSQAGLGIGMNGVRGDGWVDLFGTMGGTNSGGQTVAEGRLTSGTDGSSSGRFDAGFRIQVTDGTMLQFNFNDVVQLVASTTTMGGNANASVATTVQVTDSLGNTVFTFAPDGSGLGRVVGGTAFNNPFNLNQTVGSVSGFPASATSSNTDAPSTLFTALTDPLSAGSYLVDIRTTSQENVLTGTPAAVPEPISLALLGTGLAATGLLRRRKR